MASTRALFAKQGIPRPVIRLRDRLGVHRAALAGQPSSLAAAHRRLLEPNGGSGFDRGCRRPSEIQLQFFGKHDLANVIPAWVAVDDDETRTVEGVARLSHVSASDFPFRPWHVFYDWNLHLEVDPEFRHLVGRNSNTKKARNGETLTGLFEIEWDTGFLPDFAWPPDGARIWAVGRWIFDCGHPGTKAGVEGLHRTEIHPPKAMAWFRSEGIQLDGNPGPTRASQAVLYIGRNGGYLRQPINDRDYSFDLYLPPRPAGAADTVEVATRVDSLPSGPLPVQPVLTPFPADDPRLVRVTIPLQGVTPHPEEYGALISAGWSDPEGREAAKMLRRSIHVAFLFKETSLDSRLTRDEWHVYVGINGRWLKRQLDGDNANVQHVVGLFLHPDDEIRVTACGFEADGVHDTMGADSGVSSLAAGAPTSLDEAVEVAKAIRNTGLATGTKVNENEALELFSETHAADEVGSFDRRSFPNGKYRLIYVLE